MAATTTTPTTASVSTVTIDDDMAVIKQFARSLDGFVADFDARYKANWIDGINRYQAAKVAIVETLEPIATETVEPIAQSVEDVAVSVHAALTSPQAIRGYQTVLRGVIWCGIALVLVVGLAYTAAAWAWDAIDGEPAVVAWVKSYSRTPQGRLLRCRLTHQWRVASNEVRLVAGPLTAKGKAFWAIVLVGGRRVFGGVAH